MKQLWILVAFFLLSATNPEDRVDTSLEFFDGSFPSARELAGAEGKLLLLDFHAKWCPPCRVMEETCFKYPPVIDYVSSNYIAVKINVDNLDGRIIKEKYNVQRLPTYIVLSSDGEEVNRVEGSMPQDQFLSFLKRNDKPEYREKIPLRRPALTPTDTESNNTNTTVNPGTSQSDTNEHPMNTASDIDGAYIVQIGVYSDRERASTLATAIHEEMGFPVEVEYLILEGSAAYRVCAGGYKTRELAEYTAVKLKEAGWNNFVRERH